MNDKAADNNQVIQNAESRRPSLGEEVDYFDELKEAIGKNFMEYLKVGFAEIEASEHGEGEPEAISIFFDKDQIDNCYSKEYGWQWEIYLYKDGTWKIT